MQSSPSIRRTEKVGRLIFPADFVGHDFAEIEFLSSSMDDSDNQIDVTYTTFSIGFGFSIN